jgi:hypothetical protein
VATALAILAAAVLISLPFWLMWTPPKRHSLDGRMADLGGSGGGDGSWGHHHGSSDAHGGHGDGGGHGGGDGGGGGGSH